MILFCNRFDKENEINKVKKPHKGKYYTWDNNPL